MARWMREGGLVLAAVLGPHGRLDRAVGASLPSNGGVERRLEEGDDEAGSPVGG